MGCIRRLKKTVCCFFADLLEFVIFLLHLYICIVVFQYFYAVVSPTSVVAVAQQGGAIAGLNFGLYKKCQKVFLVPKFYFKNATFGDETPISGNLVA